ncbi:MAG: GDSL-type esterase/lipase family protein [Oscillospiraceae bacterium]|nr:GDSL-type esterase/lipase family protein [Oscillospiraceae bacterium]
MLKLKKILSVIVCFTIILAAFSACGETEVVLPDEDGWVTAWAAAPEAADVDTIPSNPGLKGNTVRQVIRPSISGDTITITLSNEYGTIPVVFESVHIAKLKSSGSDAIDTSTDTVLTFNGSESITVEAGETVTCDAVSFDVEALEDIAISIKLGDYTGGTVTCHKLSNYSTWVTEGDCVSDESFSAVKVMSSWYYITRLDVWSEAGTKAVVCLGDSITDGACSTYNQYQSWCDQLAVMLNSNSDTENISVVNMGISGNMLTGDSDDTALNRLERDVLSVSGVRYVILLIGINDVGTAQADISDEMIECYKEIISLCHAAGLKVYAGTLTPVKGNFYYSELHEKIRTAVNEFLTSDDSGFDGVIDFASAIASEEDSAQMADEYNGSTADYLHPGDAGYARMAEEAYESLLSFWSTT